MKKPAAGDPPVDAIDQDAAPVLAALEAAPADKPAGDTSVFPANEELPAKGGSYIRLPDGTLQREED